MSKLLFRISFIIILLLLGYLLISPVPVDPVAWQSPENPGYQGDFLVNDKLVGIERLALGRHHGPEDVVLDSEGRIYVSTHEGHIVRLEASGGEAETWIDTGGRPLGLKFDRYGNLIIADAYQGLLSVSKKGEVRVLTDSVDEQPILYANNLDIDAEGKIYFSDSSTKFGAKAWGGSYPASLLDLMEHGSHGRVLMYDPATKQTTVLYRGLNFANGIALGHDENSLLINETGNYRVVRLWINGEKQGQLESVLESLPAFPDNLNRGLDGRYWLGLVSPRNPMLDAISDKPFVRKIVQRLPAFVRPKATRYGHVIAFTDSGDIIASLQDPTGAYAINTGVFETPDYLYVGSLMEPDLGRLRNAFTVQSDE